MAQLFSHHHPSTQIFFVSSLLLAISFRVSLIISIQFCHKHHEQTVHNTISGSS